ncbi:restriction endonuclease [Glutamicibacter protophormiae]
MEPKYADQFANVWLWQEWPERNKLVDTGIGLVTEDRYTGALVASQAKFFDPARPLPKQSSDSSSTELGKSPFEGGIIVSTTDNWAKHAEAALLNQTKQIQRNQLKDFEEFTIDWSRFSLAEPKIEPVRKFV